MFFDIYLFFFSLELLFIEKKKSNCYFYRFRSGRKKKFNEKKIERVENDSLL